MATVLIGIDDTDNPTSRGTGHMARQLYAECGRRGHRTLSVTRHQLLLDPRIPYTSHNSGACVAVEADDGLASVTFAFDFVASRSAEGADPGVCIALADAVSGGVRHFGLQATRCIVEMSDAMRLAESAGLLLRPLGGTGLGVIGALSSVGLRAGGNDGRFIDLPGLRTLPARVDGEELTRLGIRLEHRGRRRCGLDDAYETLGWVRPGLVDGQPVLPVEWNEPRNAWIPVERKRSRPLE